jgi:exodeoxyribonuclease V beta subunit
MGDTTAPEFDISARVPFNLNRRVSIKASAGTGKTYSLTTTVARLVAEHDLRADQLLLVTFTNDATAELRLETRRRCQEALAALKNGTGTTDWMRHMAEPSVVDQATYRLGNFLTRYDEVTVTTIHGFCQSVLRQAGLDGNAPASFDVVSDIKEIISQTVTDLLALKLAGDPSWLSGTSVDDEGNPEDLTLSNVTTALNAMKKVVETLLNNDGAVEIPTRADDPLANVAAASENGHTTSQLAQRIADAARDIVSEVRSRCRRAGIITYNDMIRLVADALDTTDGSGQRLAKQLATQYPVIMIDEFQDTDSTQWRIFKQIFEASPDSVSLLTVGDPKQAIYRFRGADVNVYLSALRGADESFDLKINRRSDKPLLDAIETLLDEVNFAATDEDKIDFPHVGADKARQEWGFATADGAPPEARLPGAPLEIRYIPRSQTLGWSGSEKGNNRVGDVRQRFFKDVADSVIDMLNYGQIPDRRTGASATRRIQPSDIAVLVHNRRHARDVVRVLRDANVNAILTKTGSVFHSEAARQWLMLLGALANPGRPRDVRTFALSWFGGFDEKDLLGSGVDKLVDLQRRCAERADLMRAKGITALYMSFRSEPRFLQSVLGDRNGMRNLTDLDHIADILGTRTELTSSAGPLECLDTFSRLIEEADGNADDQKRRVETDADAVTVMTIHGSKGLQFPIVFLPTLIDRGQSDDVMMFPGRLREDSEYSRIVDVASPFVNARNWIFEPKNSFGQDIESMRVYKPEDENSPLTNCRLALNQDDLRAEQRRLLYVAMTRAMHKMVCYWSPADRGVPNDPFILSLMKASGAVTVPRDREEIEKVLEELEDASKNSIKGVEIDASQRYRKILDLPDSRAGDSERGDIRVADFKREADSVALYGFGRWSYSSVTKRLKGQAVLGTIDREQPAIPGVSDESNVEENDVSNLVPKLTWNGLPAGPGFGNDVHHVLDIIDPAVLDLAAELRSAIDETFVTDDDGLDRDRLITALVENLTIPLEEAFDDRSMADLGRRDRLSEMKFDFPLPADKSVPVHRIVALAIQHGNLPAGVRESLELLSDSISATNQIAGYMNGSIDAVFRINGETPKFVVCDYKTNKLHKDDDPDPIRCYERTSMQETMLSDGYFFQAMIYSVALQRYLRQRLPGYEYDKHFGGVSYLFLRGLNGEIGTDGHQCGHYFWQPGRALIDALDDLFSETTKVDK